MRMKKLVCLLAAFAPMLCAQATGSHFDGAWTTTMSCEASSHMEAYQWTFRSTIVNGIFHGPVSYTHLDVYKRQLFT